MNVSIETMTGLERRLTIALPSEDFEGRITEKLTEARDQVRIPGFRPGKVPLKEVRRRYGRAVRAEVAGELMQSSFFEAVQQEFLNPAGQPSLEVVKMDPGIDFEFTATFEVFPSVELAPFNKVELVSPEGEVTDDDLANMVERLREQRQTFEDVDRAVQEGDQVTVDFSGLKDGEEVEGTSGEDMTFVVGQGQMIEDFDNAVVGMSVDEEKTFDAVFPDDYRAENLQGETVQFTVTLKKVQESHLPELDVDFFKDFGVEDGDEDAFRAEVRQNMERELKNVAKNQVKQQVMDEISKHHDFQLPKDVVQREIEQLKNQMLGQFQMPQGGQAPSLPDELFQDQAEKRVKVGLVINAIVEEKDVIVDQERVEAQLQEMASGYGEPEQVVQWYKSQPEQMRGIEMGVLEDQVVDLILSEAQVEVVDSNYEDILSGKAIPQPEPEEMSDPGSTDNAESEQEAEASAENSAAAKSAAAESEAADAETDETKADEGDR